MKKFLEKLTSIRLAIGLIVYLALTGILATLVPQGLSPEDYRAMYPRLLATLVVQTGFGSFFDSILFIIPAFVFFANLSACTVKRFIGQLRSAGRKRFGPDVLHLGLMVLVLGATWSYSGHREGSVTLLPGEGVNLPDGSVLVLEEFRFERYDDGRPRDWVSVIRLEKDGRSLRDGYELRVNSPLRHAGMTLYQSSYSELSSFLVRDPEGKEFRLGPGEELTLAGTTLFFMGPEGAVPAGAAPEAAASAPADPAARAVVRVIDAGGERVERLAPGDAAGSLVALGMRTELATGIQAVSDPGYPMVAAALALIAIGIAITFIQKIKETV